MELSFFLGDVNMPWTPGLVTSSRFLPHKIRKSAQTSNKIWQSISVFKCQNLLIIVNNRNLSSRGLFLYTLSYTHSLIAVISKALLCVTQFLLHTKKCEGVFGEEKKLKKLNFCHCFFFLMKNENGEKNFLVTEKRDRKGRIAGIVRKFCRKIELNLRIFPAAATTKRPAIFSLVKANRKVTASPTHLFVLFVWILTVVFVWWFTAGGDGGFRLRSVSVCFVLKRAARENFPWVIVVFICR